MTLLIDNEELKVLSNSLHNPKYFLLLPEVVGRVRSPMHAFVRLVILGGVLLGGTCALRAQDDGGAVLIVSEPSSGEDEVVSGSLGGQGGPFQGGGGTLVGISDEDVLFFSPTNSSTTLAQGSSITFDLKLFGGGAADVHSFAIDISTVPYLTLTTITATVPSGFSVAYNNDVYSGSNVSGSDISSAQVTTNDVTSDTVTDLGLFTFTLDASAPIGTSLMLPQVQTDSSLTDSSNNPISVAFLSFTKPSLIVVAPEPACLWQVAAGLSLLSLLGLRRRCRL